MRNILSTLAVALVHVCGSCELNAHALANEVLQSCIAMSRKVPVTFSSGVAELRGGESVEGWKGRADEAMYRAKQQGGGLCEA